MNDAVETVTCPSCQIPGYKPQALAAHEGSRPCKAAGVAKVIYDQGFRPSSVYTQTLRALGVQVFAAPTRYVPGFARKCAKITDECWAPKWALDICKQHSELEPRKEALRAAVAERGGAFSGSAPMDFSDIASS